ncbi:MAG TPA: branched chain amino acid aminotransferase, partial [Cryomorphaceae bacterium]|nr:branched chain amino acid aminotransferase [Cryomorphaceae bacterium]
IPKNEGCALYLRPFMFGSSEFVAARPSEKYTMCIITSPVGPYYAGDVKVKVEETYTRSASGGVGSTKCAGNYGGAFFATDQAKKEGYTQVIWTDHKNHELVEESGTMNVAFVINDTLITPPLSDRILAGITRDSILTLLRDNGLLKVEERPVSVTEVVQAARNGKLQEAFGMGTAAVVSQICTIGFRGEDFSIPVPKDGYAMKIKKQLTDIRMGDAEDKFNWMTILN